MHSHIFGVSVHFHLKFHKWLKRNTNYLPFTVLQHLLQTHPWLPCLRRCQASSSVSSFFLRRRPFANANASHLSSDLHRLRRCKACSSSVVPSPTPTPATSAPTPPFSSHLRRPLTVNFHFFLPHPILKPHSLALTQPPSHTSPSLQTAALLFLGISNFQPLSHKGIFDISLISFASAVPPVKLIVCE